MPVQPGELLAGDKYRVESVLGVGGMGVVVAATHLHLRQRVAIKFMLPEAAADPESVQRFVREARNAALLRSEHVARVLDVAALPNGSPYIVMEYLDGMTADQLIDRGELLSIGEAVEYTIQVCEAVAEAHARGIIHRDLKLANLFLTSSTDKRALVKVIDFGLSRALDRESPRITKDMSLMGTPAYMSPEQLRSDDEVDTRTDLWALGVVLFELLCGELPFSGSSPEICSQVLTGKPRDARELRPEIPDELAAAITRCLQKDKEARYPNVAALAEALDPFVPVGSARPGDRVRRVQSQSVVPPNFKASPHEELSGKRTDLSWGAEGMHGARPLHRGWIALTAGVALVTVIVVFIAFRATRESGAAAAEPPRATVLAPSSSAIPSPVVTAPPSSASASPAEGVDPAASSHAAATSARTPTALPQRPAPPRATTAPAAPPRAPKKDNILDTR